MKKLNAPKSQTEEVLYYLITRLNIDRRQMMLSCGVLNLPQQISRLRYRYGLKIDVNSVTMKNKHDREVTFGQYFLETKKKEASDLYKKIQSENHGTV